MNTEFVDTNIVLYLLDNDPKADRAEVIRGQGPRISIQGLNETLVNCRHKADLSWEDVAAFLEVLRALCPVEQPTLQTHDVGRALAERDGLSIYHAMIAARALLAGCTTLWRGNMQDGLLVEYRLRIVNPFA